MSSVIIARHSSLEPGLAAKLMLIVIAESWVVIELAIIVAGWDFRITMRDTTVIIIVVSVAANIVAVAITAITAITANNDSSLGWRSSGKWRLTDQYHYYA